MGDPVIHRACLIVWRMAMQLLCVASLWRTIAWRSLPPFLIGGVPGVPAGAYLLLHLQTDTYRAVIGGLLIAYGGYLLLRRPARPAAHRPACGTCSRASSVA